MVIKHLPDMLRAAAEDLQGANLTVLDGAAGLSGVVASLAGQGIALLDSVRNGLSGAAGTDNAGASDARQPAPGEPEPPRALNARPQPATRS